MGCSGKPDSETGTGIDTGEQEQEQEQVVVAFEVCGSKYYTNRYVSWYLDESSEQ